MAVPYVPVPDTLQATLRYICAGQHIENVMCFSYEASDFSTAAIAVANVINTTWWASIRGVMSNQMSLNEIYMVDLASQSGPVATAQPGVPSIGFQEVPPMPNNVTLCVTFRTEQRGRSFRGRSFVVGLAANQVVSQNVIDPAAGTILNAYQDLREAAATAGVPMVVVSRQTNNAPRVTGLATPITAVVLRDSVADSQRRRLPGRGN